MTVALDVTREARALVSQLMDELLPPLRYAEMDDLRRAEWQACEDAAALAWAQLQVLARDLAHLADPGVTVAPRPTGGTPGGKDGGV